MDILLILLLASIIILSVLAGLILSYKYCTKNFSNDEFVIKLRNGKILETFKGGSTFEIPIIDELVILPLSSQNYGFSIICSTNIQYKTFKINGSMNYRLIDPAITFSKLGWDSTTNNTAEDVVHQVTESNICSTCSELPLEVLQENKDQISKTIEANINELVHNWSIEIENLQITEILA